MNTKVKKVVKMAAAALFLMALCVNVKTTLNDPFILMNEEALANPTSGGSSGWFWKSRTESCTYTVTITIGGGPIPAAWERTDTYNGTRRVCDDGWSLCISNSCS